MTTQRGTTGKEEVATLAGGCFWCLEAVFDEIEGVSLVKSGYAGGHTVDPTYQEVCSGTTGHAEVTQITYDPTVEPFPYGKARTRPAMDRPSSG